MSGAGARTCMQALQYMIPDGAVATDAPQLAIAASAEATPVEEKKDEQPDINTVVASAAAAEPASTLSADSEGAMAAIQCHAE